ncbi:MAG: pentapeptide repeat-containing protein [Magnetococcales bacterium]|nr:pentapeptide repeat-containing protein [Magnetococcales bacterium]
MGRAKRVAVSSWEKDAERVRIGQSDLDLLYSYFPINQELNHLLWLYHSQENGMPLLITEGGLIKTASEIGMERTASWMAYVANPPKAYTLTEENFQKQREDLEKQQDAIRERLGTQGSVLAERLPDAREKLVDLGALEIFDVTVRKFPLWADVSFNNSWLQNVVFEEQAFNDTEFELVIFDNVKFENMRMLRSHFNRAVFFNSKFINAEFNQIRWTSVSILSECNFEDTNFESCLFNNTKIMSSSFRNSSLSESEFDDAKIHKGDFTGARFDGVHLKNSHFAHSKFLDTRVRRMNLEGTDFLGCHGGGRYWNIGDLHQWEAAGMHVVELSPRIRLVEETNLVRFKISTKDWKSKHVKRFREYLGEIEDSAKNKNIRGEAYLDEEYDEIIITLYLSNDSEFQYIFNLVRKHIEMFIPSRTGGMTNTALADVIQLYENSERTSKTITKYSLNNDKSKLMGPVNGGEDENRIESIERKKISDFIRKITDIERMIIK